MTIPHLLYHQGLASGRNAREHSSNYLNVRELGQRNITFQLIINYMISMNNIKCLGMSYLCKPTSHNGVRLWDITNFLKIILDISDTDGEGQQSRPDFLQLGTRNV